MGVWSSEPLYRKVVCTLGNNPAALIFTPASFTSDFSAGKLLIKGSNTRFVRLFVPISQQRRIPPSAFLWTMCSSAANNSPLTSCSSARDNGIVPDHNGRRRVQYNCRRHNLLRAVCPFKYSLHLAGSERQYTISCSSGAEISTGDWLFAFRTLHMRVLNSQKVGPSSPSYVQCAGSAEGAGVF